MHKLRLDADLTLEFCSTRYDSRFVRTFLRALKIAANKSLECEPWAAGKEDLGAEARGQRFAFLLRHFCAHNQVSFRTVVDNAYLIESHEFGDKVYRFKSEAVERE